LVSVGVITGRQLGCDYGTDWWDMWPTYHYCKLSNVDLSKSFESQIHSFSGSSSQKSEATVVRLDNSPQIDFIPKQILEEFPNLNGLIITSSNFPVLKNDLFSEDFVVLEYLYLSYNKIASIESLAFQNLKNLKWLALNYNNIRSLPFNLFQKNPKLIYLDFRGNQIISISPNLLKNLNQLKKLDLEDSECVSRGFGCDTCSPISQSDLDSYLSECFQNCLKDPDCATKSKLVETTVQTTTPPSKKEDFSAQNNVTAANPTLQSLQTNLTQELANISEKLKNKTGK
jgi:Leucine-rich repeat (LRR) protein